MGSPERLRKIVPLGMLAGTALLANGCSIINAAQHPDCALDPRPKVETQKIHGISINRIPGKVNVIDRNHYTFEGLGDGRIYDVVFDGEKHRIKSWCP